VAVAVGEGVRRQGVQASVVGRGTVYRVVKGTPAAKTRNLVSNEASEAGAMMIGPERVARESLGLQAGSAGRAVQSSIRALGELQGWPHRWQ